MKGVLTELTKTDPRAAVAAKVWDRLLRIDGSMMPPDMSSSDESLTLSWSYHSACLTLQIDAPDRVFWHFLDHETGAVLGTDGENEPAVPPLFFTLGRQFGRMAV